MSTSMPWQKDYAHPCQFTDKIGIRRCAKGRVYRNPLAPLYSGHLVETTAANDADCGHVLLPPANVGARLRPGSSTGHVPLLLSLTIVNIMLLSYSSYRLLNVILKARRELTTRRQHLLPTALAHRGMHTSIEQVLTEAVDLRPWGGQKRRTREGIKGNQIDLRPQP